MKLRNWRNKMGLSQGEFAELLNKNGKGKKIAQANVCQWEHGTMPRRRWLSIIAELTEGKVKANDFM